MIVALVAVLLLNQTREPVAVVVSSKRAGAESVGTQVAKEVQKILERESAKPAAAPDGVDARHCQGLSTCLNEVATRLGPHAVVVGVDVGKVAKSLAVHLEAVAADATEPLATADFMVPATRWQEQGGAAITVFARNVIEKLAQTPAVAPKPAVTTRSDAPVASTPPPGEAAARPSAPAATALDARSHPSTRPWAFVATGGAFVGAAVAGTFLVLALNDRSTVYGSIGTGPDNTRVSPLAPETAQAYLNRGNQRLTIALVSGLSALALAALSAVLFAVE